MDRTQTRVLAQVILKTGDKVDVSAILDYLGANELEIVATVHSASADPTDGTAPQLVVKHSPVDDEHYFIDFPSPVAVDLTRTGSTWVHVPYFTRYVGWFVDGTLSGEVTVTLDITAKG